MSGPADSKPDDALTGPLGQRGLSIEDDLVATPPVIADAEKRSFDAGRTAQELKDTALRQEAVRDEKLRGVVGWLLRIGFVLGFGLVAAAAVAYVAHLVLPEPWRWLTDEQFERLATLFAGAVGTLLLNQVKRNLDK